jgi:ribokinase
MTYDIITIGDAMRDIFIFPAVEEMEKPASAEKIKSDEKPSLGEAGFEKYLVFGLGDKITISDVEFSIGGTAANVAAGLAKLGFKTAIISAVGSDNAGQDVREKLATNKVSTSFIKVYHNKKTSFSVIVSYKGERTIFVYHAYEPQNFHLPDNLNSQWLYLGPMAKGFESLFNQVVAEVVKKNLKVAVNPGAIQIDAGLHSFGGLLRLISVIFLNREEAQKLSGLPGVSNIKDVAKVIHFQGPEIVCITDGKEGAYAYNGIDFYRVGAYPAHRLDSTGAGDSFASAFLAGIIEEQSLPTCLKWGVINSASVIEKIGAQEGLLSKGVIKRRAKEYRWPADTLRFS